VGRVKIRYYVALKGRGYWRATPRMQAAGFPSSVPCGPDGAGAWKVAEEWNSRWDRVRTGQESAPKHVYPRGSLGEAFEKYRRTESWSTDKKPRTREDWDRGWRLIEPVFGDVAPGSIRFDLADRWYHHLKANKGVREAHRAVKIFRALWRVAAAMGYCDADRDPSQIVRRETPKPRNETWEPAEVARLVKAAWRRGYHGLAAAIAVAYDTAFAPEDVRALTFAQSVTDGRKVVFVIERNKTGREALGTISRPTLVVLDAYLERLPADQVPTSPIFRTRTGAAYTKNTFGKDFAAVREAVFPGDRRQWRDLRRSASTEAAAGGVTGGALDAKMANTISRSAFLTATYLPNRLAMVEQADEARRKGRKALGKNKRGAKVETLRPGKLKQSISGEAK